VRSTTEQPPFIEIRTWIKNPLHDVHGPSRYGSADHDTRHAAVQRNSGIGAAETGESVTPGRIRKRKRLGQSAELQPDTITLGAMSTGVKQYNADLDRSMILVRCEARWGGRGAAFRGS
jgi:hypothetical protein